GWEDRVHAGKSVLAGTPAGWPSRGLPRYPYQQHRLRRYPTRRSANRGNRNSPLQRCAPAYRRSRSLSRGFSAAVPAKMPFEPLSGLPTADEMRPDLVWSSAIRECLPPCLTFRHKALPAEPRSGLHSQATSFIENLQPTLLLHFSLPRGLRSLESF